MLTADAHAELCVRAKLVKIRSGAAATAAARGASHKGSLPGWGVAWAQAKVGGWWRRAARKIFVKFRTFAGLKKLRELRL